MGPLIEAAGRGGVLKVASVDRVIVLADAQPPARRAAERIDAPAFG